MRNANRHNQPSEYHLNTPPPAYNNQQLASYIQSQPSDELPTESLENQKPKSSFIYDNPNSYYMSGTPVRSSSENIPPPFRSTSGGTSEGKNTYGDEGFS